jgi:hypothetical protein
LNAAILQRTFFSSATTIRITEPLVAVGAGASPLNLKAMPIGEAAGEQVALQLARL